MDKLLAYINSLSVDEQVGFAQRCGTSIGYLRKAAYTRQQIGEVMCLRLSTESGGAVQPQDLRPGVDWAYLREALANTAQPATNSVAEQGA